MVYKSRIQITLTPDERKGLHMLAEFHHRDIRQQALVVIRDKLIELGLLKEGNEETNNKEGSQV